MAKTKSKDNNIRLLVSGAVLTAIVVILQYLGSFIRFGPFSISLVLVPIIIGAAVCNSAVSAWLGLVFGGIVLASGDAAAFLAINVPGTIATVLLKGTLAGLCAGIVFKLASKLNTYFGIVVAAIVCPVVNTGIFLLGCRLFFFETITEWGKGAGFEDPVKYMFLGLVGLNFVVEMAVNIVLCPVVVRIMNAIRKSK